MLDRASDEDEEIGVEIGTLGIFNSSSVGIWKRACYAASLHWKLKAKLNWLEENATHLTSAAYQSIKRVLTTSSIQLYYITASFVNKMSVPPRFFHRCRARKQQ